MSNIISKFINKTKSQGLTAALRHTFGKITGTNKYREEIDSLYYYLNHFVDITKLPPAQGALRKLQLCDAVLMSIFDAVCEKQGWKYWLDGGTLLGAKRHGGFLPWDDDQDVMMPRKDYEEALKILPEIFASFGEDSVSCYSMDARRFGIGYKHSQTGIWCDVFPCDSVFVDSDGDAAMKALKKRAVKYYEYYQRKGRNLSMHELAVVREKSLNDADKGETELILIHPEFDKLARIFKKDTFFPLTTIQYEGLTLKAPHDIHTYLTAIYGDYMLFPRNGLEHHDEGRGALSGWAARNNIDMDEVLAHLKEIDAFFRA